MHVRQLSRWLWPPSYTLAFSLDLHCILERKNEPILLAIAETELDMQVDLEWPELRRLLGRTGNFTFLSTSSKQQHSIIERIADDEVLLHIHKLVIEIASMKDPCPGDYTAYFWHMQNCSLSASQVLPEAKTL